MTDDDQYPEHSPLGQSLTRDGKTVRVEIYEDGEGGWLLEVVDEYGDSTVWDEPFHSDRAALDEALKTIDEEGIDSLIGATPDSPASSELSNTLQMMAPLSNDEMDELDHFLMSDATSDEAMMLDCLDGFLTAIVSGPVMLIPSEWLPHVWGPTEDDAPTFDTLEQAERITGLIMRQLNGIIWSMQHDPDAFEPVFDTVVYPDDPHEYINGDLPFIMPLTAGDNQTACCEWLQFGLSGLSPELSGDSAIRLRAVFRNTHNLGQTQIRPQSFDVII